MILSSKLHLLFLALILAGCAKKDKTVDPVPEYIVDIVNINAPSLKNNSVHADTIQHGMVMLPPLYKEETTNHYPVVYFVHGYDKDYRSDYGIFKAAFDEMVAGRINKFIIVSVNSSASLGGTFCANSTVTGKWEDHITKEVIRHIDGSYRTLAVKESRAISGFSMGGFGALYLGLRHADLFNLVYAISPGVLNKDDLNAAFGIWQSEGGNFLNAYGAAFSPDLNLSYPYAAKPLFNGTESDNIVVEKWKDGFGNFDKKVAAYLSGQYRLKRIGLDYGSSERYSWIPRGCSYLAGLLEANNIQHEEHLSTAGAHEVYIEQVKTYMLPFFSENLSFN
jgi:hypothetical protein